VAAPRVIKNEQLGGRFDGGIFMKILKWLRTACVVVIWSTTGTNVVFAGFEMPRSVYRMNEFDAAKEEAKAKNKPITFIYTREDSSCGLCKAASLGAADRLKSKSVVVYANSPEDWSSLPSIVQTALKSEASGKFIPKTVVVDAALSQTLAIVPYARGSEFDENLNDARSTISKAFQAGVNKPTALPPAPSSFNNVAAPEAKPLEHRVWRSASGTEIRAALVKQTGGFVELQKEDGGRVKIKPMQLSAEDQEYIANQ